LLDILRMPRLVLTEAAVAQLTATLTSDLKPGAEAPAVVGEPDVAEPARRTRRAKSTESAEVEAEAESESESESESGPQAEEASE